MMIIEVTHNGVEEVTAGIHLSSDGRMIMRPAGSNQELGLLRMINHCSFALQRQMRVLEIGSYSGESAELFVKSGHVSAICCVDAWKNGYDDNDLASHFMPMDEVERSFNVIYGRYQGRIEKIKSQSHDAVSLFDDGSFDLVYIDAAHTYTGCKQDIEDYLPKVRTGGYLAGHDYCKRPILYAIRDTIGVVDENFIDYSWIKRIQ